MNEHPSRPLAKLPWGHRFPDVTQALAYWAMALDMARTRWGPGLVADRQSGTIQLPGGSFVSIANIAEDAPGYDQETQRLGLYRLFSLFDDLEHVRRNLCDWEWVAPRLRLRLLPNVAEVDAVGVQIDPMTRMALAIDNDEGCIPLDRAHIGPWGVTEADLWRVARHNMESIGPLEQFHVGDHAILGFDGDLFTSGILDRLENHLDSPLGIDGALVASPVAHTTFVAPLHDLSLVEEQLRVLIGLAIAEFAAGPNRVTPSILWYRGVAGLTPGLCIDPHGGIRVLFDEEPLRSLLTPPSAA